MPINTPTCYHCGERIKSGRSDKKFCNSSCKDAYYNTIKNEEQSEIRKIDLILKKNRRVLKKLFDPANTTEVKREELIREGLEFGFHTHVVITKMRMNEIVFCYDYGYREAREGIYQLYKSFSKVQVKDGYELKL